MNVLWPCLVLVFGFGVHVHSLVHQRTLMWTVKSAIDGSVDVRGVPGDPEDWVFNGITQMVDSYFTDPNSRAISRRVALAFHYSTRRVFFADRGFKQIFRIILPLPPPASNTTVTFSVPIEVVYGGISTAVNGLAMDWASGSIYWTDALYNWIVVANASDYQMVRYIVHTGLGRPMGVAVHPKRGQLYWSLIGAVPKIERSTLAGESRINFVDFDLDRPLGLSIDYKNDHLYWVDDLRDTIERVDLDDPTNRWSTPVGFSHGSAGKLFGLAVYNDFIFATDQVYRCIDIFNKTTGEFIGNFSASIVSGPQGIPYDIQMYDGSLQEDINSDCKRLNCSDICISDGGQKAHCMCQEGYSLSPADDRTCVANATFRMPQYLYSVGQNLCGTDVVVADQEYVPTDIRCYFNVSGHDMKALGFNAYAGYVFFSDSRDKVIHRMLVGNSVNSSNIQVISANTGNVSGISVDWIADNLYWTDESLGVVIVSRLTGRFKTVLLSGLDRPQSLAVNPLNGTLYVATPDTIFWGNMDGTNFRPLINLPGASFDGMVLDIQRDFLYWVDQALPGIRSCRMNGTGLTTVVLADRTSQMTTFRDVTVYENYIAWTDGVNSIYFGLTDSSNPALVDVLKGIQHAAEKTSHDIITYDYYLQPPLNPGTTNPCDLDNDPLGCSQLCLLTPTGRRCACSTGFLLVGDTQCVAQALTSNFLLFIDPYPKTVYQFDLQPDDPSEDSADRLRGLPLGSSNQPTLVAYDRYSQNLFWFDIDRLKNSIKRATIQDVEDFHVITTLEKDVDVSRIDAIQNSGQILMTDAASGSVFVVAVDTGEMRKLAAISNAYASAVTLMDDNSDIYWVDGNRSAIFRCGLTSSCSSTSGASTVLGSWSGSRIAGLNIAQNGERTLILWTATEIYKVKDGAPTLLLSVDKYVSGVNLADVVMTVDTIYFISSVQNTVYQYKLTTQKMNITLNGYSQMTDLKLYYSPREIEPPAPTVVPVGSGPVGLGTGAKVGIALGVFGFLLLLILLILLLVVLWRRHREKAATPPTVAFSNHTYGRLSSIVSTLSSIPPDFEAMNPYDYNQNEKEGTGFPPQYDADPPLYFADDAAAGGAAGYDFYPTKEQAPELEKKLPLPMPEVSFVDLPADLLKGGDVSKASLQVEDPVSPYDTVDLPGYVSDYQDSLSPEVDPSPESQPPEDSATGDDQPNTKF